ncbi:hydrogenase-2 assembly chaperone [Enterobacteriaceae bacterium RIT691]|nr:hydrogenase-2 assembly chaperone [Enterobacteriaceae bacterium RIT691]
MPGVVDGMRDNPSAALERAFQAVAASEMRELPFFLPQVPVRACGFVLYEQQWLGCLLTPWMLSLLVLPGPQQRWEKRRVGDKLALSLPCGDVRFTVGEITGCGQYLAASLMSPLDRRLTPQALIALADSAAKMALSLPLMNGELPANPSRRSLFTQGRAHA